MPRQEGQYLDPGEVNSAEDGPEKGCSSPRDAAGASFLQLL